MFGLGTTELLIIFAILLVLFGARRLPKLGRSIGDAVASFKKGTAAATTAEPNDQTRS